MSETKLAVPPSRLDGGTVLTRLGAELRAMGHAIELESPPLDCIAYGDLVYLDLLVKAEEPTWYTATWQGTEVGVFLTPTEALAGLLLELHGAFDSSFETLVHRANSIVLMSEGAPVGEIAPVEFAHVDAALVARVAGGLKGVFVGDLKRGVARLRDVPGLERLGCRDNNRRPVKQGTAVHRTPANIAGALRAALASRGVALSIASSQELLARIVGVRNWSTLIAMGPFLAAKPYKVTQTRHVNGADVVDGQRYFRGEAEALAFFAVSTRARNDWPLPPVATWDDEYSLAVATDFDFGVSGPALDLVAAKWGGEFATDSHARYAFLLATRFLAVEDPSADVAEHFNSDEPFNFRADEMFPAWKEVDSLQMGPSLTFTLIEDTAGRGHRRLHGEHHFNGDQVSRFTNDVQNLRIARGVDGTWYLLESVAPPLGQTRERLELILEGVTSVGQLGKLVLFAGMQHLGGPALDRGQIDAMISVHPDYGIDMDNPAVFGTLREPHQKSLLVKPIPVRPRWQGK